MTTTGSGAHEVDVRALLVDVVRTDVPALDDDTPLKMIPGLDSLGMVSLVLKLESALDRQLTEEEIGRLSTVRDLRELMRAR
jgi:acyl carrier protein